MVGVEFLDYIKRMQVSEFVGVEDFADKMSFMYSVVILLMATTIIAVKQYLLSSISCYIPTVPSGSDFDKYLMNYCWVHGTIPILPGEPIPQNYEEWHEADTLHRINYYQWVPFMLGLQCILFYLPRVFWQVICYNRTGTDLEHLVKVASDASSATGNSRKSLVSHVATTMESMLFQHREFRVGNIARAKRKAFGVFGMFFASKRMGTWLIFTYMLVKVVYLINAVMQLYLMQKFLGFDESMSNFGYVIATRMIQGVGWNQTRMFPRVSFCYMEHVRHLGTVNRYVAQCVLPVNMLNEKLYIFLWFWTLIVICCTAVSIPMWILRIAFQKNRCNFIKKFLCLQEIYTSKDAEIFKNFISDFLRHDGVFLIRMISMNAGDVVTGEVAVQLWDIYREKYKNRKMLETIALDIMKPEKSGDLHDNTRKRKSSLNSTVV